MISKKKLIPMLVEQGFITSERNVNYEAFGRKVMAFVRVATLQERNRLEAFLRDNGISFNPRYWPGAPVAEVRVSYFKAWHHDE
jgi:hypothetical protein